LPSNQQVLIDTGSSEEKDNRWNCRPTGPICHLFSGSSQTVYMGLKVIRYGYAK